MTSNIPPAALPATPPDLPVASAQDGTYPRPQLIRPAWCTLDGTWAFRYDDENRGRSLGWPAGWSGGAQIVVPFPPESPASGIDDPSFHPVVWYARTISAQEFEQAGLSEQAPRLLLHFGAVDYSAEVWLDGSFIGSHEGGQTPFTLELPRGAGEPGPLDAGTSEPRTHTLVVRAQDDPHDLTQPRGKQDWHEEPHAIWYQRTTGIWQSVWLEAVPEVSIEHVQWLPAGPVGQVASPGVPGAPGSAASASAGLAAVELTARFRGSIPAGTQLRVALRSTELGVGLGALTLEVPAGAHEARIAVPLPRQRNGQGEQEIAWSPEHPHLIDATLTLSSQATGQPTDQPAVLDVVSSYLGLRTVGTSQGAFLLNGQPYNVRSVLNQGYWPQSHLAAPSPHALRQEVQLIKDLGFTACRIHQKIEDPRFLYWADRLGLLVWAEAPGAYEFSPTAIQRFTREWLEAVDRDSSHPCVVTWVPFNESWGVQHIADDPAQQAYVRALTDLTRALDPSRLVVSNDGWEQQNTDVITVHDYEGEGAALALTYADSTARARFGSRLSPSGRQQFVAGFADEGQPFMLTEFGGINFQPDAQRTDAWGYTAAANATEWLERITKLYDAIRASDFLAGSCYTQLTDTLQETNGLLSEDRVPKAPIEQIRQAITGRAEA